GCPCTIQLSLYDGNAYINKAYLQVPLRPDSFPAVGTGSIETVVPVQGDQTHRYRLVAFGISVPAFNVILVEGSISATYSPLSGDGDSTAQYELTCPKDDPWEQNDAIGTPSTYWFGTPVNAIACPTDQDWYADAPPTGVALTVLVDGFSNAEGNIDVCLYRNAVLVSCATGTSDFEVINVPSTLIGTYSIKVYLASDAGSFVGNTYTLTASY
ncbi:MAG: hypothetical protein ABIP53_07445, partial [Candidatus Limnocylindrales bacterium]